MRRAQSAAGAELGPTDRATTHEIVLYAGEKNDETGAAGCARREGALDAGGRVCARGGGSHSRGETWRGLGEAGHRHRALEGAARGGEAAAAEVGQREGDEAGGAGQRERSSPDEAFGDPIAREHEVFATTAKLVRFASRPFPSGARGREETDGSGSFPRREESGAHGQEIARAPAQAGRRGAVLFLIRAALIKPTRRKPTS